MLERNILKVSNQGGGLNFKLLDSIFTIFEHEPDRKEDIFDSYSENQFKAKSLLVNNLDKLDLLNKDTEVVIFGCWYGSILIPLLHDKVKKITAIDIDDQAITIGDNRLFDNHNKITWITGDAFEKYRDMFDTADIFINTSCEHMLPMNEWGVMNKERGMKYKNPWWTRVKPAHFAFTSNNMFDIPGHINCVNSIEEFKGQLPTEANVLVEDELEDERGTRYLLIGKL
jgi:SAM-dependent methyltransferase